MKIFKKISLLVMLLGFTITAQAQQKNAQAQKKADESTAFITEKMNLSKEQTTFLYETLLTRFENNSKTSKDNSLSEEGKKEIYKNSYKETQTTLAEQFSKEEISKIDELLKQYNNSAKK